VNSLSAFWITLNFVLLLLAFYLILYLYQRIKVLQKTRSEQNVQESEQLLAEHIQAVRHENEQFLEAVRELFTNVSTETREAGQDQSDKPIVTAPKTSNGAKKSGTTKEKTFEAVLNNVGKDQGLGSKKQTGSEPEHEWMPPIDSIQDHIEESPYVQAMKLKEEGKSITEIAKKMKRGKGEIELLLRMHGKN
jgi:hypothetical protein